MEKVWTKSHLKTIEVKYMIKLIVWFDNNTREQFRIDETTKKNVIEVLHEHNYEGVLSITTDTFMWKINLNRVIMINILEVD